MTYQANIGGHAPGDLRDQFVELLHEFVTVDSDEGESFTKITHELWTTAGRLWNCTDISPEILTDAFEDLGYLRGGYGVDHQASTYARAARLIRYHIRKHYSDLVPAWNVA